MQSKRPIVITKKKTKVEVQVDDEADDEPVILRKSQAGGGTSYFPVHIGTSHQGAIAIANAYSNGRGGTAASRATAYGNSKKDQNEQSSPKKTAKVPTI